ncbi:hypothetical protein MJO28_010231 [Puccinia striiformis f. sp. tritici]|uniref:Histone chaperone domain-containing protein n=4 Tax=Puccinia striiformis TaxID=27350 RepID=A0A0L0VU14_9BASI|nr:hypothetical protein Pst134EA_019034 [Puccinia striiformis f. sp. tritici]KNF02465.1 hypothetical protein PSTG_04371 [Puccinia striiformis f. sp. tritici PST-78]POW13941.1 hypothetical protein PSTT_03314 [Puccinia striiformis]KAH9449110.1 hypothetical protein Pst134EB_019944 [Puccinia striiformis f. sp. tritici]KAH9458880.1 hypothetical protein Pst134EA_019034 [Puccinia striiformis f. sp. tritici]KAI7944536.1 hypothetical protein MJO28_010231 [Puccinia striiformis f. sp. tritici]
MSDAQPPKSLKRAGDAPADPTPDSSKKCKPAPDPTAGGSMDIEDDNDEIDDLAEIDPSNIISGSRTRGKKIDFSKAEVDAADEDDDEDEDVVPGDETMDMDDEDESGDEDEDEDENES